MENTNVTHHLNNYDPLKCLCIDVYDLIFQHVNVLTCSAVSPKWYNAIADSKKATSKIVLHLGHLNVRIPCTKEIDALVASGRKYSNVVLKGFYLEPEMQLVFKALQNCIVELDLHFVVSIENFSFPVLSKLKTLRISETYCETFVLNILRTSNTLIKVIFEKENYRESFFALIREFFLGDNQIKELKMYVHVANRILGQTIGQSLQLESFKLCIDKLSATLTNINDFLATQTTLKNLDLCVIEDSTLKIITESLINLEYLKLHCIDSLNLDSFTRYSHLNPSVVDLKLESFTTKSILMFLKLFPNLKVLRISWATDRELLLVFKTAKKLEKIYVKQRMELSLKLYNEMKEAEEDINRNIQFLKDKS